MALWYKANKMTYNFTNIFQYLDEINEIANSSDWQGEEEVRKQLMILRPLLRNRLKGPYTAFVPQSDFHQLESQLRDLLNHTESYAHNGHSNYLMYLNRYLNSIREIIAKIPVGGKGETSSVLSNVVDNFTKRNDEVIKKITKEKDSLAAEVAALKHEIKVLSNEVAKKNTEVTSLTTEFQKQFSDAQDKRGSAFSDSQNEREEEFNNGELERANMFREQINSIQSKAQETQHEIENIHKKVEEIYGVIGKSSIVGSQKTYADKAKIMAHCLQGASLFFMLCAIGVLCYMFYGQIESITWAKFFFKFSIGLILLLPSFFLANEAKKQRDKENHYRELEIKLVTITPYFLEIQSPEKEQVKLDLAKTLLSPNKNITDNNAVLSRMY